MDSELLTFIWSLYIVFICQIIMLYPKNLYKYSDSIKTIKKSKKK